MLIVVFGAGASYDSVPARPPNSWPSHMLPDRLPLANELFDDRPEFAADMRRFERCQPIVPYLQRLPPDSTVERVLEGLQAEAVEYPERYRQLAATRYYLHFMIWRCELRWNEIAKGVTNYKTLLDQLQRWRRAQDGICLVTFNYDRMLEDALPTVGVGIRGLPDYIANDNYKVIKLHGSVHWAREVDTPIADLDSRNTWQVAYELIDRAADLAVSQRYRIVNEYPIGKRGEFALFPALAIPVETKGSYECPPEHLEALRAWIPEMTKLLIIGWRATEVPFLRLLAENLRPGLRVMVVAGRSDAAAQVIERLQKAGIQGQFHVAKGGFTEFAVNREADEFLKI